MVQCFAESHGTHAALHLPAGGEGQAAQTQAGSEVQARHVACRAAALASCRFPAPGRFTVDLETRRGSARSAGSSFGERESSRSYGQRKRHGAGVRQEQHPVGGAISSARAAAGGGALAAERPVKPAPGPYRAAPSPLHAVTQAGQAVPEARSGEFPAALNLPAAWRRLAGARAP